MLRFGFPRSRGSNGNFTSTTSTNEPKKKRGRMAVARATTHVEGLESRMMLAGNVFISEFMADNASTLKDNTGAFADWIELHNPTSSPINLDGYYLTDKKSLPTEWRIPAITLPANGYKIIFATSSSAVPDPNQELHTNFSLSKGGEYLGLYAPDGSTVLSAFDPTFPAQTTDKSYGTPVTTTNLVSPGDTGQYLIPTANIGNSWQQPSFVPDATWTSAATGIGFGSAYGSLLGTDITTQMKNKNATAYVRMPFTVADPAQLDALTLRMRYNDGFVVYLNGTEIARKNAPASLNFNSAATQTGPTGTGTPDVFDVSLNLANLVAGNNVLAIQGLNTSASNSDFIISPELVGLKTFGNPVGQLSAPTPGTVNLAGFTGAVADTQFDHDRGLFDTPFDLNITTDTQDATIVYTLDGSAPTQTHGATFTGAIHITTTSTVRAMAFKTGYLPTDVDTQTFIRLADVVHQPATIAGFPNGNTDPAGIYDIGRNQTVPQDMAMDQNIVNNPAYTASLLAGLQNIPTMSIVAGTSDIWGATGFMDGASDRPGSVEYIDPAHPQDNFQVDAALDLHSHLRLKQSIDVKFKAGFGPTSFETKMFQDFFMNGGSATDTFEHFVLRAGNNRSWARAWNPDATTYAEDEWYRQSQIALSGNGSHGTFVQLYINGVYWGLYNPVEKPDEGFDAAYFGGDKDDWFAIDHDGPDDGDPARWNTLMNTIAPLDMTQSANYQLVQQYLDVNNLSDYLILSWFQGQTDWPTNNWWAGISNNPAGPAHFTAWDGEWSWDRAVDGHAPVNGAFVPPEFQAGTTNTAPSVQLFRSLIANSDFQQNFADRIYRAIANNGALTDANTIARWDALTNYIKDAVVGESARWGDSLATLGQPTRTRDVDWQNEVNNIRGIMTGNGARFVTALRAAGFYPSIDPATMNQQGGTINSGFKVLLTNPNGAGQIYYTLDGSDPRASGGGLNPNAILYTAAGITLTGNTQLNLRVLASGTWSALNAAAFTLNTATAVRITEINYHPIDIPTGGPFATDDFEYIELRNTANVPVNISGYKITNGITYTVPANTILAAGANFIIAKNLTAFAARYGTGFGTTLAPTAYSGSLSNSGEEIDFSTAQNVQIEAITYADAWYPSTDGDGKVLVINNAGTADVSNPASWHASLNLGGSPGVNESPLASGAVVINEISANAIGAGANWIELKNTAGSTIDVSGWFISDSADSTRKYQIASGTTISAGGLLTLTSATSFGVAGNAGVLTAFDFTQFGGHAVLSSGDAAGHLTGYGDDQAFGGSDANQTYGRYAVTGGSDFFTLQSGTKNGANAAAKFGAVVINEIQYDPSGILPEYLELLNTSGATVNLFDPANPSSVWKFTDGVDMNIPAGASLAAGEFALVVPIDPTILRTTYRIPASIQIFGPYAGAFANEGENVEISRPGTPVNGVVPYIPVDHVNYSPTAPWPTTVVGTGPSLSRVVATNSGSDPANWTASPDSGTPGYANATTNSAPVVAAGSNQIFSSPQNSTTLAGAVSDDGLPYGSPLTISWSQTGGPNGVIFADPANPTTSATFPSPGTFTLKLTADDGSLANFSTVTITVTGPNAAPIVSAGSNQTITLPNSATLAGSSSDDALPLGSTLVNTWSVVSGPGNVNFNDTHALNAVASFSASGDYVLRLTGSDGQFNSTSDVTITVKPVNQPPIVNAGVTQTITLPATVTLLGSASDDNEPNNTLTTTWSKFSGPGNVTFGDTSLVNTTASFSQAGTYVLRLTAFDGALTSTSDVTIIANPSPGPAVTALVLINTATNQPVAGVTLVLGASNNLNLANLPVGLSIRADVGSGVGSVRFGFDANNNFRTESTAPYSFNGDTNGAYTPFTFTTGTHTVRAQAFSGSGAAGTAGTLVTVTLNITNVASNQPPVVSAGSNQAITLPANQVTLAGTATDTTLPNGPLVTTWTTVSGPAAVVFGNANALNSTATFTQAGTYVLRLTASDGQFAPTSDVTITVNPAGQNAAPIVNAGSNQAITLPANQVTLAGTASDSTLPNGPLVTTWSTVSGPAAVVFGNANALNSTATFTQAGTYVLRLTASDGQFSPTSDVTITVNPVVSGPTVTGLTLINTATNQPVAGVTLTFGATNTLNLANLPAGLSIRADVGGGVGSVRFGFDANNNFRTESTAPYSFNGDTNGAFTPFTFALGTHTVRAQAFAGANAGGTAGGLVSLTLNVVNVASNQPPVVNAGSTQTITLPANQVTLAGSATDTTLPNGPLVTTWSVLSGPGTVTFGNVNALNSTATFSTAGTYVLRLTASDGQFSPTSDVTITVNPAGQNAAPIVSAGNNQTITLPTSQVTLAGTATDSTLPNGPLVTTWTKFSGPGTVTFGNSSALNSTATFSQAGTYVLRLTASDGQFSPTSDVTIVVNPQPTTPTVTALVLINTATGQPVAGVTLNLGGTTNLNLALLPPGLSIRADASSGVGSIRFGYDSNNNKQTESTAPYSFNGDANGVYTPFTFTVGTHTVRAQAFSGSGAAGTAGTQVTVTLNITNVAPPPPTQLAKLASVAPVAGVNSLSLIDATTGKAIAGLDAIDGNITLKKSDLPKRISIAANVSGDVASVRFGLKNLPPSLGWIDSSAPFKIFGGYGLPIALLPAGTYTMVVTPFSLTGGKGLAGDALTIRFTLLA